ncbi:DUF2157 domain-containing protein [Proteus sp. TSJ240517]|uniref:DUF2157 domain-containing protein n=1 Tax=Proteus sp. TSJ240517 TaxID=3399622 RepID=UPI003A4D67C0
MQVTRKQERLVRQALDEWQQSGAISTQEYQQLGSTLHRIPFDWKRLSRYAFWIAMVCLIIAAGSIFSDSALVYYLIEIFSVSEIMRVISPALIASALYLWGFKRQREETQWHYSTEFILFLGVMFTAIFLWQLGELLDTGSGHIAPLFLIGCVIYGAIGFISRSSLVWLFFLLMLGNWFGAETGYMSGWGAYWLGMNYPIRFVFFGSVLLAGCYFLQNILIHRRLFTMTKIMGLTYLFIALWIMSIFGNYDPDTWYRTSSVNLLPWALLFGVVAVICIYISLKTDDGMLRGFGLTFLGINLYTRFFEYFWDSLHSAIFFFILAVSLILIGRKAEKIWHAVENNSIANKESKSE